MMKAAEAAELLEGDALAILIVTAIVAINHPN